MQKRPNVKSSNVIYKDTHIQVKQDVLEIDSFSWNQVYLQWNNRNAVCVIPYEADGVYLVRQYRHPANGYLWQFPGGLVEPELSEKKMAARELQEEAGFEAKSFKKLGVLTPEPGLTTAKVGVYLATGLGKIKRSLEKSETGMMMKFFSIKELEKQIKSGKISCGITLSAYLLLDLHLRH